MTVRPGSSLLDVGLSPAQHQRSDALAQPGEILVLDRTSALVELVELAVETEQRAEQIRIEILDDRIELVDPVLDRRAGQHEGVRRAERLHAARRFRRPVLDALRLVEHDDVRLQYFVDVGGVAQHLLIVDDGEEGRRAIGREALGARSEHEPGRAGAEAGDLLFPFRLQRRRANDEDPLDAFAPRQQLAAGDGLDGLAEPHVVGEQSALAESEVHRALALIRQQRMGEDVERRAAGGDIGGEGGRRLEPLASAPRPLQPGSEMAGDSDGRANGGRRLRQGRRQLLDPLR